MLVLLRAILSLLVLLLKEHEPILSECGIYGRFCHGAFVDLGVVILNVAGKV